MTPTEYSRFLMDEREYNMCAFNSTVEGKDG